MKTFISGIAFLIGTLFMTESVAIGQIKISNLSSRVGLAEGSGQVNVGLTLSRPAKLLVRVVGPSLTPFNIANPNSDPYFSVYSLVGEKREIASNDDWSPTIASVFRSVGAFSLISTKDAATVVDIAEPGSYSVVAGSKVMSGIVLVEVYDIETTRSGGLVNLSVRARVTPGEGALIVGFTSRNVGDALNSVWYLVRGIGPSLSQFGIADCLKSTRLGISGLSNTSNIDLENTNWKSIFSNDYFTYNWGAFRLLDPVNGMGDSAIIYSVGYGSDREFAYTAVVTGNDPDVNKNSGIALVEMYWKPVIPVR